MRNKDVSIDTYLSISGIQHFAFCKRQWALIHNENLWVENRLTAEGRTEHERAHNPTIVEKRGDELVVRALQVRSDILGLIGECDAVVFVKDKNGTSLFKREGLWIPMPVEYKHGTSKINNCDRLQVVAQAICLEEMYGCCVPHGAVFYRENNRRELFDISEDLREEIKRVVCEMHELKGRGYTPKDCAPEKCGRCSLKEVCLPIVVGKKKSAIKYIKKHLDEAEK